jgi:hypothetical protein
MADISAALWLARECISLIVGDELMTPQIISANNQI